MTSTYTFFFSIHVFLLSIQFKTPLLTPPRGKVPIRVITLVVEPRTEAVATPEAVVTTNQEGMIIKDPLLISPRGGTGSP